MQGIQTRPTMNHSHRTPTMKTRNKIKKACMALALLLALTGGAVIAQGEEAYERGRDALDDGRWADAIAAFDEATAAGGRRSDAALYWKAYSEARLNRNSDALETLTELRTQFPNTRWKDDASALEREIRRSRGDRQERRDRSHARSFEDSTDTDADFDDSSRAMAIQALLNVDAERAVPILAKFLRSDRDPELKQQALFVLIQHGTPEAYELTAEIARNSDDHEMQEMAIHHLGIFGGDRAADLLEEVFHETDDPEVQQAVLQAWMVSGQQAKVLAAARDAESEEVREHAVHQLGVMGAAESLEQLWAEETSTEVRESILQGWMISGHSEPILRVARSESDEELRETAINLLGVMGQTAALGSLFADEKSEELRADILHAFMVAGDEKRVFEAAHSASPELREEAINLLGVMGARDELRAMFTQAEFAEFKEEILHALFIGGDGEFLAQVAKSEADPEIRAAAIHSLSLVGGRRSSDLLLELYESERDPEVKEAVMNGLFIQGNVKAMIRIARNEADREARSAAVRYLSMMNSAEATEFLLELLEE